MFVDKHDTSQVRSRNDLNVFNSHQFAYVKGRSTVTPLLSTLNDWTVTRNSSIPTDVIFLDFAKAFDSVAHEKLLLKLERYGHGGDLLLWFRNLPTNRKQRVTIRGTCSE